MMKVLERVTPERRLKTGWLLPLIVGFALSEFRTGDTEELISRSDRVSMALFMLVGILAGVLWQWYSPRDLAERLSFLAGLVVVHIVLRLLPFGAAISPEPDYFYLFPFGLVAGLVLTIRWQRERAED